MKSKHRSSIEVLEIRRLLAAVEGIDTSFGTNGRAAVPADVLVVPLADGEYLAIGSNRQNDEDSAAPNVSLLTSGGSLDTSFGNGGQTVVPQIGFGAKGVVAKNLVLIASNLDDGLVDVFALQMDGTIDESFAAHSFVDIPAPPLIKGDVFDGMTIDSIAAQSDGSAIVAVRAAEAPKGGGTTTVLTEMARVTSKGKFDTGFGDDGFVLVASHVDKVNATLAMPNLAVDSEDRIVVTTEISGQRASAQLDRFNADGTLDTSFSDKGVVTNKSLAFGNDNGIYSLAEAIQPDDKILIAGTINMNGGPEPAQMIRLNSDGSLDPTFGTDGLAQITSPVGVEKVGELSIDSQGRIIVSDDTSFRRLTSTGAVDSTFSTNGVMDFVDAVQAAGFNATNVGVTDAADRIIIGDQDGVIRLSPQQPAVLNKKGVLTITGSDGGDIVGVSGHDGVLHANVNGAVVKFALSDVKKIDIELGAGTNTLDESVDLRTTVNADSGDSGTDSILTGGGDDAIAVAGSSVTIDAGAGDDVIFAGGGAVLVHGGPGNDYFVGPGITSATVFGDGGNDSITGGRGDDFLYGGAGNDTIRGSEGNDLIDGNGGNDRLFGNDGVDHIHGGDGNDFINSAVDGVADVVDGGAGNDTAGVDDGIDVVTNVEHVS